MGRRIGQFTEVSRTRFAALLLALCGTCFFYVSPISCATNPPETKHIVVFYPEGDGRPGNILVDRGIRTALESHSAETVEIYNEYLDLTRFSDEHSQQLLADYLREKYAGIKIDVVILGMAHALDFALKYREQLFPEVPIVFCAVEQREVAARTLGHDVVGVPMRFDLAPTLDLALRLHPETKHVYVISGAAKYDAYWQAEARQAFRPYEGEREFTYLSGLTTEQLLSRVAQLPEHSIVYYLHVLQDGTGKSVIPADVLELLAAAANAPVYGHVNTYLGRGIVGGRPMDFETNGLSAGRLALRILSGDRPESLGVSEPSDNAYQFDWRQLRRWGIDEKSLPQGSIVLFKQPTFWDLYSWHAIAVIVLCAFVALLIVGLLMQRAKRRRAEQRFGQLVEDATNGMIMIGQNGSIDLVNAQMEKLFGYGKAELVGQSVDILVPERFRHGHTAHRSRYFAAPEARYIGSGRDLYGRRKDGSEFPVEIGLNPIQTPNGLCVLATIVDITERKRVEDSLRESEARFRLMGDAAPVLVWMSGPDKRCTYFNEPWLQFTGRPLEQELGNGWWQGVHPDDLAGCLNLYTTNFDARQPFQMEYRLRRHDGQYRWVVDHGVPRFTPHRTFAGYIGACIDVTDRKLSEEELRVSYLRQRDLAGKLLTAQESERRRIARELHDDLNQGLALVAVELELLGQRPPEPTAELRERLRVLASRVKELSTSVHDMSHRLHPSKLEQLGLVSAVRGLCKELTDGRSLPIEFTHRDMPERSPEDVSICLYRIVQESLANVIKHSGARRAGVDLRGSADAIELRIVDDGIGFDPPSVLQNGGLGFINIRERLHLVGGEIAIDSKPSGGTRIHVRVPLNGSTTSSEESRTHD